MSGTIFHPFVLDNAAGQETVVGIGSDSEKYGVGISSDTHITGIQTVTGFLHADGGIKDSSGNIGSSGKVLSSTGSGLEWIDPSEGSTANAVNVGTNLNSTDADQFVAFMGANSGNNPVRVDSDLRYNPSTNILTAPSFSGNLTGTIQTAAQTNITSLGTLTGLTVNGNITQSGASNYIRINGGLQDKDGEDGDSGQVLSSTGSQVNWVNVGDLSAGSASQVAVSDESTDTTCFPLFVTGATGNQSPKSGSNLSFNSSTGQLNATKFVGDGSGLTGVSDTTYDLLAVQTSGNNNDPSIKLDASSGDDDEIQIVGGTNVTVTRNSNSQITISSSDTNTDTQLSTEQVQDIVGNMVSGNTESGITVTYQDGDGTLDFSVGTLNQNTTGTSGGFTAGNASNLNTGTIPDARLTSSSLFVTGMIIMWNSTVASIPSGWVLCDGNNGTPDLRDRFIVGAGSGGSYSPGNTGGSANATLVSHSHTINNHTHSFSGSGSNTHNHGMPKGRGGSQASISNYIPTPRVEQIESSIPTDNATISISISGDTGNPSDTGTDTQGSSATNANLPPYYALCYIMKT